MTKKSPPKTTVENKTAINTGRRSFLKNASVGGAAAVAGSTLAAP